MQCRKRLPPAACARAQAVPSVVHTRSLQAGRGAVETRPPGVLRVSRSPTTHGQKNKVERIILLLIFMFAETVLFYSHHGK